MSWSALYYGKESPSRSLKLFINCLMLSMGLCIYGMWTDFVPSLGWALWGFRLSLVITGVATVFLYWGYGTGRIDMQKGISKLRKILALIFLPFLVFGILWIVMVHGLADLVTLAIGERYQQSAALHKEHGNSRSLCNYRLKGEAIDRAFPNWVCISGPIYDALPPQPLSVKLEGKTTILGFHIQSVGNTPD